VAKPPDLTPLRLAEDRLELLDQRKLPGAEEWVVCRDADEVARAIEEMVVRGAPAIGIAAAQGLYLGCRRLGARGRDAAARDRIRSRLAGTRPTARNLFWALERMEGAARDHGHLPSGEFLRRLQAEAEAIRQEDVTANRALAQHGEQLVAAGARILTHCNAGALATGGYGTALGVVRRAHEVGKGPVVLACETRPLLQGARLTAWELARDGIPVTLITDGMAAHFMGRQQVDVVLVGADRIAANGDTANKVGTYGLAMLAAAHGIPFLVAAPTSTLDAALADGAGVVIEHRHPAEVLSVAGIRVAPAGVPAANPAFDVTPHRYISAIITERGVHRPPFGRSLAGE